MNVSSMESNVCELEISGVNKKRMSLLQKKLTQTNSNNFI